MEATTTEEVIGAEVESEVEDDFEFDRDALNDLLVMKFRS